MFEWPMPHLWHGKIARRRHTDHRCFVPGVRGKQRWVAAVRYDDMLGEVRKHIPPDAKAERSNQHLSQEQAAKLHLKPGDVRRID
jgi:hypothetical protein